MTLSAENKKSLRLLLKDCRRSISSKRREEAKSALENLFLSELAPYRSILSFHSLEEEIDTSSMNAILAKQGRLHLPKVETDFLHIYRVLDPSTQLAMGSWQLWEPDPSKCEPIDQKNIDCILVPGLGFDQIRHRIGYGKGHYDRLLSRGPKSKFLAECGINAKTIGIGFKEQLFDGVFPSDPHDIPLDRIALF
jgi:5-formyltetrahydrofolate cyclo-ligase